MTQELTLQEIQAIAKEAFIYAYPMVDGYRIMHTYSLGASNHPEYKGPINTLCGVAKLLTHEDTAVQTPNADTPYCSVTADLRAEPLVLTIPSICNNRYYSIQFIDAYTHNFAFAGTRTTAYTKKSGEDDAYHILLAGPDFDKKELQKLRESGQFRAVYESETSLAMLLYRTQLFEESDLERVRSIISGYKAQTLSQFRGCSCPPFAEELKYPEPIKLLGNNKFDSRMFTLLSFMLTHFCPTHASEKEMMERFAKIGISSGLFKADPDVLFKYDVRLHEFSEEQELSNPTCAQEAVLAGMKEGWKQYEEIKAKVIDEGMLTSADLFGTREHMALNTKKELIACRCDEILAELEQVPSLPGTVTQLDDFTATLNDVSVGGKELTITINHMTVKGNNLTISKGEGLSQATTVGSDDICLYMKRMAGAVLGIWGVSIEEAMYCSCYTDSNGNVLDGRNNAQYTITLDPLPPADAFWSVTMYYLPEQLFVDNTYEVISKDEYKGRYLINSAMEEDLAFDGDTLKLYIQHDAPKGGKDSKEYKNWLPAPDSPFFMVIRMYLPQEDALKGVWTKPDIIPVKS